MAIKDAEERINRILNKKQEVTLPGNHPGESFDITVTQGDQPLQQASNPKDVTLHVNAEAENRNAAAEREARAAEKAKVTELVMPDSRPTDDDIVIIGNVRMEKNKATGFERRFQKFSEDYFIFVDSKLIQHRPMEVLFNAIKASQQKPAKVSK